MENPFTDEKKEAMQEAIQSTVQSFVLSYTQSFGAALVESLREGGSKRRTSTTMPTGLRLVDAPDPTEVICEGFLEKKGAIMKNWKKRWFVCSNKDKNFVISYYASQTNLKKAKGEILLDGYSATSDLTEDETKDIGEFGIKMTCGPTSKRRVWYLRCPTKEDVDKFMPAIKNACKKAKAAFKAGDPVEGAAFQSAYNSVREEKGLGPKLPGGSEGECLGGLITEVVTTEVMGEVFEGFPDTMQGRVAKTGASKAMDVAITAAVGAAWAAAKGASASARPAIESGIKAALGPIVEAEQMLFGKIGEAVSAVTDPAMETVKGKTITPLVGKALAPIASGFLAALRVWATLAKKIVTQVNANAGDLQSSCNEGYRDMWRDTKIDEACAVLLAALEGMGDALGDFPASDIVLQAKDSFFHLLSRGIATLQANIQTGSTPDEAYTLTLGHAVNDAGLMFADVITAILSGVVMPSFNAIVKEPVVEAAAPIDDLIPEPVKAFLSLGALIEGCLDSIVETAIGSVIDEVSGPELEKIKALEAELV